MIFLSLLLVAALTPIWSAEGDQVEVGFEYFEDNNGVVAQTPILNLKKEVYPDIQFSWEQEIDAVSGASRILGKETDGVSGASITAHRTNIIDAISGATSTEVRYSQNLGLNYNRSGRVFGVSYYTSFEDDYRSHAPGVNFAWDFFDRNLTLGGSYSHFFDNYIGRPGFDGHGKKDIDTWSFSLTQSLTPTTLVSGSINYVDSWGYLGKPYSNFTVPDGPLAGVIFNENLPAHKLGIALNALIIQGYYWDELLGSLRIGYRYYDDSWGIQSHTYDIKWYQYLTEENFIRLRYRQYHQSSADFVSDYMDGSEYYRTGDIRFYSFNSYLYGFKFHTNIDAEKSFVPDSWNFKVDLQYRDTRRDFKLYQYNIYNNFYWSVVVYTGVKYDF